MILVVGHGPSSLVDPDWVDAQDFIVRILNTTIKQAPGEFKPHIGTRYDAVAISRPRYAEGRDLPFWLEGDYREICRAMADPYTSKKLSMGTNACLIAHHKYPDQDLGVIGFDTTMKGIFIKPWPYHDAEGEGKLLRSLGVEDFGYYG